MDDADLRAHDARLDASPGAPAGALTAAAFITPWALLSFALPAPWRWKALALLGLLALLLVLAAWATQRLAADRGADPAWWGFLAVVTFGLAMLAIYAVRPGAAPGHAQYLCGGCGRLGDAREPFCFGCGAYG